MSTPLPVQTSDFIEDSIINLLPKITTSFYSVEYEPLLFKFNIASVLISYPKVHKCPPNGSVIFEEM